MPKQPTQEQLFYQAHRKLAEANETFMGLVNEGLTREDLQRNIERRPSLWARWSNWLSVLPRKEGTSLTQPR